MPIAVTAVLFIFWIAVAYREFQRGDLLLAGVFAAVGIVITLYRVRVAQRVAKGNEQKSGSP